MGIYAARYSLRFSLFLLFIASGQGWPLTRAEKSNYNETSHYADVIAYLHDLQSAGAPISVQMIGQSAKGREIPLVIAGYPPVATPAEARRLGRPIVYIQANIHAGEVEGKEAALIILRRLSQAGPKGLLGKIVLLVTPIYNIDGNEQFAPVEENRPEQDGPAMVGVRPNGQGLDLNRDAIKAESPEMGAVLAIVYTTWDPDVMMDLQTTDGTRHGYELTYAPPCNPNTEPAVLKMARDEVLPAVRDRMSREYHLPLFDYGNAEGGAQNRHWATFGEEGRYCTNYVGLRNRLSFLSEATTFIPFKARIEVTDKFVSCILDWVAAHASKVLQTTRDADAEVVGWGLDPSRAPALGVRFALESRGVENVLLEKLAPGEPRPPATSRPKRVEPVKMPIFDRFKSVKSAAFPAAYLIPSTELATVALLRKHGIVVEKLTNSWSGEAQDFAVSKCDIPTRAFQGHKLVTLDGTFGTARGSSPAGTYLVRTAQPLGILIFNLLEPESKDGVAAWGMLAPTKVGDVYPILKLMTPPAVPSVRVE